MAVQVGLAKEPSWVTFVIGEGVSSLVDSLLNDNRVGFGSYPSQA